jgi:hypothetical protein
MRLCRTALAAGFATLAVCASAQAGTINVTRTDDANVCNSSGCTLRGALAAAADEPFSRLAGLARLCRGDRGEAGTCEVAARVADVDLRVFMVSGCNCGLPAPSNRGTAGRA